METQSIQQVDPAIIVRPSQVREMFSEQPVTGMARNGEPADCAAPSIRKPQRKQKLTAVLDPLRKVIVEGVDSTMDGFFETLEMMLTRTKAARKRGIELPTFLAMLRDQAGL